MANVLNRTTKQYITSANTPDYPTADWIINPDLSGVSGVPSKYWKITGDVVTEMNQTEKDAVDAALPRRYTPLVILAPWEPASTGVSNVLANDRSAIECVTASTGWAATSLYWSENQSALARLRATVKFVLKEAGTGTKVRVAFRAKASSSGDDSYTAFTLADFTVVTVTHTTIGEVFQGVIDLDIPDFEEGDAVAAQVGRDGDNDLGAGDNDDVSVAVQIISVELSRGDA